MTAINTSSMHHQQQQQYVCEVQPPTPIMCQGTFADYVEQSNVQQCQQQQYLNAPSPSGYGGIKRQPSTGSFSGQMGTSSTSYDLSGADETSSSSGSNSHYTNDPYSFANNSNNSSYSNSQVYEQQDFQQQQQQQQQQDYPQYQQQQQAPMPNYGANVPPSLQQAALNRRRDQQQQQQQYDYPQYQQQQQEQDYPYPQYQQQESTQQQPQEQQQQAPRREFAAHSNQQFQRRSEQEPKASLPFPECCYHKALVNRMEFIQPPPVTSAGGFAPHTRNTNYLRVFVGQCRFESTAPEVRWLIHYLTGVQPVKVELRGSGCFMAYVQNYEEVYAILRLKERLLFDHTGVWFAREEEQAAFLRRYVQSYVSSIGKGFRLPKDMVVLHDQQLVQQQQRQQRGGNSNNNNNNALPMGAPRQARNSTNNFYSNHH